MLIEERIFTSGGFKGVHSVFVWMSTFALTAADGPH